MSRIKNLASDTVIYGGFTMVARFLTFMLTPLYTNHMTMEEFADIQYVFVILAIINIVYSFGMDSSFFRFYNHNDEQESNKVFAHSYISIFLISLLFSLLFIIFSKEISPFVSDLENARKLIILAAIVPLLDALMLIPYAFLRMTRQSKKFALTKFILVIIAVVLNFVFVVNMGWGAEGVLYAQIIANFIGASIFVGLIKAKIKFEFDKRLLLDMFKFGIPTLPAMLSGMILQVADRWILKPMTDSVQFAIYQCNHKLAIPMILFVSVFEYAWKPFYLSHYQDKDAKELYSRVLTYFTLIAAMVFLVTTFYMDFLVRMPFIGGRFINPDYWVGMDVIPIILIAFYFNGVYNNIACGFHIEKKTQFLPIAIGIAAGINIALNFILIPHIGYWGSTWATLIAYFISAVVLYFLALKIYPINYQWIRLLKIIFLTSIIYLIAVNITDVQNLFSSFLIRTGLLILFLFTLYVFKVVSKQDLVGIKGLFKKKQPDNL